MRRVVLKNNASDFINANGTALFQSVSTIKRDLRCE